MVENTGYSKLWNKYVVAPVLLATTALGMFGGAQAKRTDYEMKPDFSKVETSVPEPYDRQTSVQFDNGNSPWKYAKTRGVSTNNSIVKYVQDFVEANKEKHPEVLIDVNKDGLPGDFVRKDTTYEDPRNEKGIYFSEKEVKNLGDLMKVSYDEKTRSDPRNAAYGGLLGFLLGGGSLYFLRRREEEDSAEETSEPVASKLPEPKEQSAQKIPWYRPDFLGAGSEKIEKGGPKTLREALNGIKKDVPGKSWYNTLLEWATYKQSDRDKKLLTWLSQKYENTQNYLSLLNENAIEPSVDWIKNDLSQAKTYEWARSALEYLTTSKPEEKVVEPDINKVAIIEPEKINKIRKAAGIPSAAKTKKPSAFLSGLSNAWKYLNDTSVSDLCYSAIGKPAADFGKYVAGAWKSTQAKSSSPHGAVIIKPEEAAQLREQVRQMQEEAHKPAETPPHDYTADSGAVPTPEDTGLTGSFVKEVIGNLRRIFPKPRDKVVSIDTREPVKNGYAGLPADLAKIVEQHIEYIKSDNTSMTELTFITQALARYPEYLTRYAGEVNEILKPHKDAHEKRLKEEEEKAKVAEAKKIKKKNGGPKGGNGGQNSAPSGQAPPAARSSGSASAKPYSSGFSSFDYGIIGKYNSGMNVRQISTHMGVRYEYVQSALERAMEYSVGKENQLINRARFDKTLAGASGVDFIVKEYQSGKSAMKVAETFRQLTGMNVSESTVFRLVKESKEKIASKKADVSATAEDVKLQKELRDINDKGLPPWAVYKRDMPPEELARLPLYYDKIQ